MSWQATAWACRQTTGSTIDKCVLLLIANEASKSGVCFPGRKYLAEEAECTPETITNCVKRLEAKGLLWRHERRRANKSRTTDWIVLAPRWADRGEMRDADPDEYPNHISVQGMVGEGGSGSPERGSGEPDGEGVVDLTGGPYVPVKDPVKNCSGGSARTDAPVIKVSGKKVDPAAWHITHLVLESFNEQADRKLRLLTSAGQPSEAAKRIYGRVVLYPDIDAAAHRDIIRRTLASRWWGADTPTIGVVYGPRVFEENITRAATGSAKAAKADQRDAKKARAASDLEAIRRMINEERT